MKASTKNIIQSGYYQWKLYTRNNVYYADGRSNGSNAGKISLGTKNYDEAIQNLRTADMKIAARNGNREAIAQMEHKSAIDISLTEGIQLYLKHTEEIQTIEEKSPDTPKRYRAALEKFREYIETYTQVITWGQMSDDVLKKYISWLSQTIGKKEFRTLRFRRKVGRYAKKSLQFEIETIKQAFKYLSESNLFAPRRSLKFGISVPDISDRYCYSNEEVQEILKLTKTPEFKWLHDICLMLSKTGVRIGELINMRWDDLVEKEGVITGIVLRNGTLSDGRRRRTKNRQDRFVPFHKEIVSRLKTYEHHKDGYIFHGPLGGRAKDDTIRIVLKRDILPGVEKNLKAKGIQSNATKGCLHSFRHYFCSQCVRQGMPQQVIQRIMGHKDSSMVRHYLHLNSDDLCGIINKVKL